METTRAGMQLPIINTTSNSGNLVETSEVKMKLSRKSAVLTIFLAAACVGISSSLMRTMGFLYAEVQYQYNATATQTSAINSFFFGSFYLFGPGAALMLNYFGYASAILIGSLLVFTGVLSSAYVSSVQLLYLTYGIMPGIGIEIIYNCVYTLIGNTFDERRPLANNILLSAASFVMMPMVMQSFVDNYGLQQAFFYVAIFIAVGSFLSGFILTIILPRFYPEELRKQVQEHKQRNMPNCYIFKKKVFLFYILYSGFAVSVKSSTSLYVVRLANSLGVKSIKMAEISTTDDVFVLVLRFITGFIYSRKTVFGIAMNRLVIMMFFVSLRFIACLLLPLFATNLATVWALDLFLSFTRGCIGALPVTVMTDLFGKKNISSLLGFQMFVSGIFSIINPLFIGWVLDYWSILEPSSLYRIPYFIAAISAFICPLLLIPVWYHRRNRRDLSELRNVPDPIQVVSVISSVDTCH